MINACTKLALNWTFIWYAYAIIYMVGYHLNSHRCSLLQSNTSMYIVHQCTIL